MTELKPAELVVEWTTTEGDRVSIRSSRLGVVITQTNGAGANAIDLSTADARIVEELRQAFERACFEAADHAHKQQMERDMRLRRDGVCRTGV
ncbi:MAG: hypothetical protein QNJ92_06805 [Alphaproteobacteria bacterium]|nr:hypothetical protein [Alphaproteobacteria bacterium]